MKDSVQSGAPVLRGTRMPVHMIVDNFDYGVSVAEIAEQFEIPGQQVEVIITYARNYRGVLLRPELKNRHAMKPLPGP